LSKRQDPDAGASAAWRAEEVAVPMIRT
jgi:hypothetical protein